MFVPSPMNIHRVVQKIPYIQRDDKKHFRKFLLASS
jgi:hypothetical protein